jgi:hypothetical protein
MQVAWGGYSLGEGISLNDCAKTFATYITLAAPIPNGAAANVFRTGIFY